MYRDDESGTEEPTVEEMLILDWPPACPRCQRGLPWAVHNHTVYCMVCELPRGRLTPAEHQTLNAFPNTPPEGGAD
jgi:hypothetical protein